MFQAKLSGCDDTGHPMPAIPEILPAHLEQKGQLLGGRKQVEAPGEHTGPYPHAHVSPCCSWPELHQPESGLHAC